MTVNIRPVKSVYVAFALILFLFPFSANAQQPAVYNQPYRPQFHFSPAQNWTNDPNGTVYYDGEYHLFFQYNPFGNTWGHMSWGHAVSKDLVHWKQMPVAIPEANNVMIFSGSAVVDRDNTSGFGTAKNPPMVAIYAGYHTDTKIQDERIAYSTDHGRTWTKYKGNPVIAIGSKNFRDPKVFWYAPGHHWIMIVALSDQHKVRFYSSPDLKHWKLEGEFGPKGATGGVWECPDLFPLRVEGDSSLVKWVLEIGLNPGSVAGGSGGQYFIGNFNGKTFRPDSAITTGPDDAYWVDYGKDFYAATSWSDIPESDGRRIWIGWLDNWEYAKQAPTTPWRGAQSIPRSLHLKSYPYGMRLIQQPVRELKELRGKHYHYANLELDGPNSILKKDGVEGTSYEVDAVFRAGNSDRFGLKVRKGNGQETTVGYDAINRDMYVDRTKSGNTGFSPDFPGIQKGPLAPEGDKIRLHIFVDRSSVEVFGNDGQTVITDTIYPDPKSRGIELFSKNGKTELLSLDIWKLKSIWGNRE